jgi:hypothetical protein
MSKKPEPKLKTKDLTNQEIVMNDPIGPDEKAFMTVYGVGFLPDSGKILLVGEMPVIFVEKEADRLARELNKLTGGSSFLSMAIKLFKPTEAKVLTPAKKPRKRK